MALTESLQAQAIRELGEMTCQGCGGAKLRKHSFCGRCYMALPERMRRSLYSTLSENYANNYDDAKTWLKVERGT